jgi:hypothetical protein
MGMFMADDDMYIEALLEDMNLRFGAFQVNDPSAYQAGAPDALDSAELGMRLDAHGIAEIRAIQKDFEVFRPDRRLVQSMRALGVGGRWHLAAKRRWYKLLSQLDQLPSSDPQRNGGDAIVAALIDHLMADPPDPVHFRAHDATQPGGDRVLIIPNDRPLFYLPKQVFLTISLPMREKGISSAAATATP